MMRGAMRIVNVRVTEEDDAKIESLSKQVDDAGLFEQLLEEDLEKKTKGPRGYSGRKATTRGLLIRRAIHLGLTQMEQDGVF